MTVPSVSITKGAPKIDPERLAARIARVKLSIAKAEKPELQAELKTLEAERARLKELLK